MRPPSYVLWHGRGREEQGEAYLVNNGRGGYCQMGGKIISAPATNRPGCHMTYNGWR